MADLRELLSRLELMWRQPSIHFSYQGSFAEFLRRDMNSQLVYVRFIFAIAILELIFSLNYSSRP